MRYLGIDYGRMRTGIALSDPDGRMAFPERVILGAGAQVIQAVGKIADAEDVSVIVVGLPIGLDGKDTAETKEVRQFVGQLSAAVRVPVYFENEMLTTRMAEAAGKGKMSDASAAAIILQSYLDKRKG